ncbi:dnaJ homolog subfamily C member 17-like [Asterias amurensis]|uniref:dnaJ homolog subfamily C member 17-like n=1 Tax=Asterias amurensis TaxID=7602 RepID=UPI003AB5AD6C
MAPPIPASETDLYEILGVLPEATPVEIKKAYRKKALTCHPDKNPDNPAAAKQWEELSNALQILTDSEARAAYDKVLKAKKATELRNRALESKRRKVKEDLEAREAAYREETVSQSDAAQKLARVIKKLQEEGSRVLAEEQRILKEQLRTGSSQRQDGDDPPRLKIKWKSKKTGETNGGYSYDILYKAFQKYGPIANLLVSSRKNGSAVVEFGTSKAAELAVRNEIGLSSNPLQLSWLSGQPTVSRASQGLGDSITQQSVNATESDFESLVLEKMRNAQQLKKTSKVKPNSDIARTSPDGSESIISNSKDSELTPETKTKLSEESAPSVSSPVSSERTEKNLGQSNGSFRTLPSTGGEAKDYESLVLMRMRQAQERQRLIEQMAKEDAQDS